MGKHEGGIELKTSRIEALSDGIFAIAMTILILSFETIIQRPTQMDDEAVLGLLIGLWPDFLHYVISFVILGAFWFQHHFQFHHIKKVDLPLIYINIAGLLFVGLIPFTTVIVSDYGNTIVAAIAFELNMLIAGLIFFIHWRYAAWKHHLLDADIDPETVKFYTRRNLIIPGVSLLAMAVSCFVPRFGTIVYLLVPVVLLAWKVRQGK